MYRARAVQAEWGEGIGAAGSVAMAGDGLP